MSDSVHVKLSVFLFLYQLLRFSLEQTETEHTLCQQLNRFLVWFVNRNTGTDTVNNGIMRFKDKLIDFSLCVSEGAVCGEGPSYIAGVSFVFRACVNKYERVVLNSTVVRCIVERRRVAATRNNSRKGCTVRAVHTERGINESLQLVLIQPWSNRLHCRNVTGDCNFRRQSETLLFRLIFD